MWQNELSKKKNDIVIIFKDVVMWARVAVSDPQILTLEP